MAKALVEAFLIPLENGWMSQVDAELGMLRGPLAEVGAAFARNLQAALNVGSVPYHLSFNAALDHRFDRLFIAEKIRAGGEKSEVNEEQVWMLAHGRFEDEMRESTTKQTMIDDVLRRLRGLLPHADFAQAAEELLSETLVMAWGAFEVLVSDVVRCVLNDDPSLAVRLASSDPSKRHFDRVISLEVLASYGFDMRQAMGDFLSSDHKFDNLQRMRDTISVLFPASLAIHAALASDDIYDLWQRRHLIVHRRGVVDERYVRNTRTTAKIGERLHIVADDAAMVLRLVADAGSSLLAACRAQLGNR